MMTVFQADLVGFEERYTIGIFYRISDARMALCTALKKYRRYMRALLEPDPRYPRGSDLHPSITRMIVGEVDIPSWWSDIEKVGPAYGEPI
jgi:hypothetical protein